VKKNRVHIEAMEARSVDAIPTGEEWQYEPKWDGFRCLLARDASTVGMYSKSGQDLSRYFPEVVAAALCAKKASSSMAKLSFLWVVDSPSMTFCSASILPHVA
jgi:ATP-dependent DNA ligase